MPDERMKRARYDLEKCGYVENGDGTWTGKYYAATITNEPTPSGPPSYIINFTIIR